MVFAGLINCPFLRSIFYALGYPVPSTKGMKFDGMEFWMTIENNGTLYKIYRHNSFLSIDDGSSQVDYSLPTDWYEIHAKLTGCNNKDIAVHMAQSVEYKNVYPEKLTKSNSTYSSDDLIRKANDYINNTNLDDIQSTIEGLTH